GPPARASVAITFTPWAAAIARESASASSSEACSQPQLRQTTSQPPSRAGRTRTGCWGKEKMTAVMMHNPVADRGPDALQRPSSQRAPVTHGPKKQSGRPLSPGGGLCGPDCESGSVRPAKAGIYISRQFAYVVCLFENSERVPLYGWVDRMNGAIRWGMVG